MTKLGCVGRLAVLFGGLGVGVAGWGQSVPTATQAMELSVFGAGTETFTGLENDRNSGMTAGVDLAFRPYFGIRPALELRGTDPFVNHGDVVSEKNGLIGLRFMKAFGRFQPYVDLFYGRGALNYVGGFIVGTFRYDRTTSNVFAGGGGIDYRITPHFDIKADAQIERYATPVTTSGTLYSTPVSLGVVYHFDFNRPGHHERLRKVRPEVTGPVGPSPEAGVIAAPAAAAPADAVPAAVAPAPADMTPAPVAPAPVAPGDVTPAPAPVTPPVVDTTPPARTGTANPPAEPHNF